ncbi:MAG TPA: helix-turn-helix transcriptional regulator [Acidimicrobiales bacterium]|nr:helix-turn-helix transcriptional regulator [Acidimicrobiales bacterium]
MEIIVVAKDSGAADQEEPAPGANPLAELLRRLRLEAGLSQYELAKRTGINRSTLLRIEAGTTTNPDAETLNRLARAFAVEPEVFYDAVWQDAAEPLPSPALYFRSKYRLSDAQIAELEASLKRVTEQGDSESQEDKHRERRSP